MTTQKLNTTLHTTLEKVSENAGGFSASEITGYSPEMVRRAAEALVAAERLHRAKVSPRRVRYFATAAMAKKFVDQHAVAPAPRAAVGTRMKARWSADEPAIITPRTRITIAPTPPRGVYRTNTYLQF